MEKTVMSRVQELIGMKFVEKKGGDVGRVKDAEINSGGLTVEGITITEGVFNEGTHVWRKYVDGFRGNRIFLSFDLTSLENAAVYVKNDKKIGVISVVNGGGKKTDMTIHIPEAQPSGTLGLSKSELVVPVRAINAPGRHILIDITKSQAIRYASREEGET